MRNYKPALIALAVTAAVWIGFDIFLAWAKEAATISQAMVYLAGLCATFPLIMGHLTHHFFWPEEYVWFRRTRNIANVIFLLWFVWDLINGIIANPSAASSGMPSVVMFLIGFFVTGWLWPQRKG